VEVRTYDPLVFGALALLDTEPPFFEFPLITIGDRRPDVSAVVTDDQAVALASFRFEEDPMPEPDEKKLEDEKDTGLMQADDGEGGEDAKSAISSIEAVLKELEPILALKDKILELVGGGSMEEPEQTDGPVDQPVAAMSAEVATLEGRIAGLEQYRSDAEAAKVRDALYTEAVEMLEADRFSIPDKIKGRLKELAGHGKIVFQAFVDSYREAAIQDPDPIFGTASPGGENWPEEVMVYAQKTPEEFIRAKDAFRDWRELKDSKHFGANVSPLSKYLEREVG